MSINSFHIRDTPWRRLGEVWGVLAQRTRMIQAGQLAGEADEHQPSTEGPCSQTKVHHINPADHVDSQRPSWQSAPSHYHACVPLTTRLPGDTLGKRHGYGERAASPVPEKVAVMPVRFISLQSDCPASNELAAARSDWRRHTHFTCMVAWTGQNSVHSRNQHLKLLKSHPGNLDATGTLNY